MPKLNLTAQMALDINLNAPAHAKHWALLKAVSITGSMSQAAKLVGISYKAAWDNLAALNEQAAQPLLHRTTGGKGGGATTLTPYGQKILKRYEDLNDYLNRYLNLLNQYSTHLDTDINLLHLLNMQTSASNQFSGSITQITTGQVNDEVTIAVSQSQHLVASVTSQSRQSMNLNVGDTVFALIQAASIMLVTHDTSGAPPPVGQFSARNQITGTIQALNPGAVNAEVIIEWGKDLRLVTMVTQQSAQQMNLKQGQTVTALFKAGHVMLGKLA